MDDRSRWNKKWSSVTGDLDDAHELLLKHRHILKGLSALDLACGRGQNTLWLASVGYKVLGVDISAVALNAAEQAAVEQGLSERARFEEVDLRQWQIPQEAFDLVIVFRFLDRNLFSAIKEALRPEGWLFYHTRHVGILSSDPQANPNYLLEKGELTAQFSGWHIYFQRENSLIAEIVAQKPPA